MSNLLKIISELNQLVVDLKTPDKANNRNIYYLMGMTRELLEEVGMNAGTDPEVKILKIYCHWVLHSRLSNDSWIYKSLVEVNEGLRRFLKSSGALHLSHDCVRVLDLDELRNGFIYTFSKYSIDPFVFRTDVIWPTILPIIIGLLEDKILAFPKNVLEGLKPNNEYQKIIEMESFYGARKIFGMSVSSQFGEPEFILHTDNFPTRVPVKDKGTIFLATTTKSFYVEIHFE